MNEFQTNEKYPSLLRKQMVQYWMNLMIAIFGLLTSISCLIFGIMMFFSNIVIGIILVLIAFLLSPMITRSFVRYLQGYNAYKQVKALKNAEKVEQLIEFTQLRGSQPTRVVQIRMVLSMFALVDLGAKEVVPIIYDQYRTAKEHHYNPERYHEALEILARKLGFSSTDELFEEYQYKK